MHLLTVVHAVGNNAKPQCLCGWQGDARWWKPGFTISPFLGMYGTHINECYKAEEVNRIEYQTKLLAYLADTAESTKYLRGILEKIKLPTWLLKTSK